MKIRRYSAHPNHRRGFTLIELLVVISIIATLISLIAPAVQSARNAARLLECQSNMHQVATAITGFAGAQNGALPYLVDDHGSVNGVPLLYGWVVDLFPYIDQAALYRTINEYASTTSSTRPFPAPPALKVLTCPVDLNHSSLAGGMSYVANVGYMNLGDFNQDIDYTYMGGWALGTTHSYGRVAWNNGGANPMISHSSGVFWREDGGPRLTLEFIGEGDGQTNTYLVSENVQSSNWFLIASAYTDTTPGATYGAQIGTGDLGFGIPVTNAAGAATFGGTTSTTGLALRAPPSTAAFVMPSTAVPSSNINAAIGTAPRPSAFHTGVINMAYCDGRASKLNITVDSLVYASMMTPNGQRNGQLATDLLPE